ncbi:hypothetical protein [Bacillus weihaiensis]|uniref:hypothetical protein n=1 Tax=Bacillus weihaiensis TaxID=1547283 RepID=UPI0023555294|nr:hypothetical protein [Bacillus weihaiensis]
MDANENTLYNWMKKYGQEPEVKSVQTFSTAEAELRAIRKEMRDLMALIQFGFYRRHNR